MDCHGSIELISKHKKLVDKPKTFLNLNAILTNSFKKYITQWLNDLGESRD